MCDISTERAESTAQSLKPRYGRYAARWVRGTFALALISALSACGGGGSSGTTPASYTIGGQVTGLTGAGLVLQDNGADAQPVSAPGGSFTFTTALASGASYAVTVQTQPAGQTCTVTAGTGSVASVNVTTVAVACATTVAGMVWDSSTSTWDNASWQ